MSGKLRQELWLRNRAQEAQRPNGNRSVRKLVQSIHVKLAKDKAQRKRNHGRRKPVTKGKSRSPQI